MPTFKKTFVGIAEIIFHYAMRLLPVELCSYIGYLLGRIAGLRNKTADQRLRSNIVYLRPDINTSDELEAIVRRTWGNLGRVMTEFSVLQRIWRSDRTSVEGLDNLAAARANGRPRIFLFLHLGNWEIIGPKLLELGEDLLHIYQQPKNRFRQRIVKSVRQPYADRLVGPGPNVARLIYKKLKEGGTLGIGVDEFVNSELYAPLFGRPARFDGNLAKAVRFAKMTNAVLCPVYATRIQSANFLLNILPPIHFDFTDFGEVQLREAVQQLDAIIDPIVRQHIDQWFLAHSINMQQVNKD